MKYRQHFESNIEAIRREGRYRVSADLEPQTMEFTSLSDALISLIPIYGPWIIFGIVAFESAGVPLPGEAACLSPERQSLLPLHSLPPPLVRSTSSSLY